MAKKYYIPRSRGDLALWLTNYKGKIAVHGAAIGLSAGDITTQQGACTAIANEISASDSIYNSWLQQVGIEKAATDSNLLTITNSVKRQKTHPDFTPAIGDDLGVIGEEVTMDTANAHPTLKLQQTSEGWVINFSLQGFFGGVRIERKRPAGSFEFLAIDTASPYVDTEAQQNGTEYRAVFLLNDQPVGLWSASVVVQL